MAANIRVGRHVGSVQDHRHQRIVSARSPVAYVSRTLCSDPAFVKVTKITSLETSSTAGEHELALARLIVKTLNLDVDAAAIDVSAPLYGEGLGLDSIDILEIALAVSQSYGVKLRSDDKQNDQIFSSLANLSAYIQQHRP